MNVQKKIASKILKCGIEKVWIDPTNEKVKQAITRRDVRRFIKEGVIKRIPGKKKKSKPAKPQQRMGSRKGKKGARRGKKSSWLRVVRPQRKLIKELEEKKQLTPNTYRKVYKLVKGGMFRSRSHLMNYLEEKKMLKKVAK